MVQLSRRNFLGGAMALFGTGGYGSLRIGVPNVSFGVISDIHVTTPESTAVFRSALKYFRDRKVDAVVVAGDLSDWGLRSGLKYVADAWYSVFPNDHAPDGRKVEKLFCTGNHDYDGYMYGDITLDMHVQGYSETEALRTIGMKRCWEEAFNEPFAAVRHRTVKGYDFISAEWKEGDGWHKESERWFAQNAKLLDPKKPFFFFTHYPLGGTTSCSGNEGNKEYPSIAAFKGMPNAVAFSGHCHWTLNDERSIWQGEYTAIAIPSMSYTTIPGGYENGGDSRMGNPKASMAKIPARSEFREAQGYLVSVYDDRMEVERRDFTEGVEAAPAWVVTSPAAAESRYAFANSKMRTPVPEFPEGAKVSVNTCNTEDRDGHWAIMMRLEFPSARARSGRVFDYEVRIEKEDGTIPTVRRFLAPAFYRLERDEPARQNFLFNAMDLPETGRYRFRVYPRNCFGECGKPIESNVFQSVPGKDKIKKITK